VEMLGYVDFPAISKQPYRLTLAPYAFFWLEIHGQPEQAAEGQMASSSVVADTWEGLLDGAGRSRVESILLPEYLPKQRWFGGKARRIRTARIEDWMRLPDSNAVMVLIEVQYERADPDIYFLPLGLAFGKDADRVRETAPGAVISHAISREGPGVLHDASADDGACASFLSYIAEAKQTSGRSGSLRGIPGTKFEDLRGPAETSIAPRRGSAEQSNTSLFYGDRLILKLFRRQQPGPNPDCEMGQYLTEKAHFDNVPQFAGAIEYVPAGGDASTLAMLQGLVANQGDGWTLTLEELARYYENCATAAFPEGCGADDLVSLAEREPSQVARDHVGLALDSAARLGQRTAELHLALAATVDPAFAPETLAAGDVQVLLASHREHATRVLDLLKDSVAHLPDDVIDLAGLVLGRRKQILDSFRLALPDDGAFGQRIRVHGDYHLGQVLQVKTDFVILDFEGEPARPIAERRAKQSPLKDVAGMIRSLAYASYSSLIGYTARRPEDWESLEPWARLWERSMGAEFLRAWRSTVQNARFLPPAEADFQRLLAVWLMDKALYELAYELNNRPDWVRIPLTGILSLPVEAGGRAWNRT
jgi:maltose alpha-D-glucosyltransferase/alpha-amylase